MPIDYPAIAQHTARLLLDIEVIRLRPHDPFTLTTAGKKSPAYVDCRRIISYPKARATLMDFACDVLRDKLGSEAFDYIAGGETAGIPFASLIADRLAVPMCYVRKKPKGYGLDRLIEGVLPAGKRVLLVEDLASDGNSKFAFVKALRDEGKAEVKHCFVIFFYDIFKGSREALAADGITIHALATWSDVLVAAGASDKISAAEVKELESYIADPEGWSARHGGTS